jgi:phage FluMu gp28-like protein
MPDAIELGFLDIINQARGTNLKPGQFLADCRSRAGLPEIYEQSYLCNPVSPAASIVDWSAIERCRHDYQIERLHLDHDEIQTQFGPPTPHLQLQREQNISEYLHSRFPTLFSASSSQPSTLNPQLRLGFDIAASGHGSLACIYIDSVGGEGSSSQVCLAGLFTCRTDDWHFLKAVLFTFLRLPNIRGAGDESGLGRQICWEAANHFGQNKFIKINFASKKSGLGFLLMNQLSAADKRFPKTHPDIAADFFALRKNFTGTKWLFSESKNPYNSASHCDIAWAGALASEAHAQKRSTAWAMVG